MSQYDFGTIDPFVNTGEQLADMLNNWRDAIHSWHRGPTRPGYAVPGMLWINDTGGPTNWIVSAYMGPTIGDIALWAYDTTTGVFTFGNPSQLASAILLAQAAASPSVRWNATGNAVDAKAWRAIAMPDGRLHFGAFTDAGAEVGAGITMTRDGKLIADLSMASGAGGVSVGTTPPASPQPNQLWWNSDASVGGGQLFIYYNDGNTTQWVPVAAPAAAPTPQVMQAALQDPFTLAATAWTDIIGLSVTITPRSTASRFRLDASIGKVGPPNNQGAGFRLQRNGAPIGVGNLAGARLQASFQTVNASSNDHGIAASFSWIDSPGTVAPVTYNVQAYPQTAGVIINASGNDANDANIYHARTPSTLIVTEVL